MEITSPAPKESDYDLVGPYCQDDVNGFTEELLDKMLGILNAREANAVLDVMAGDGNLTLRLFQHCKTRGIPYPLVVLLDISRVQCEIARTRLPANAKVVCGDALKMSCKDTGKALPREFFDRVMIKSASHEFPADEQSEFWERIFEMLCPGGFLVNMGFLFEDRVERDELREIARVKDSLAGLHEAARRRHFLLQEEYHSQLSRAGFEDIRCESKFEYAIHSSIVAQQYFSPDHRKNFDRLHQAAQARALTMRKHGRIRFDGENSTMICPGEITMARKPLTCAVREAPAPHPYDVLRKVTEYNRILQKAASLVGDSQRVLEIDCGIGLWAEQLRNASVRYEGIDSSERLVRISRGRFGKQRKFQFHSGSFQERNFETESYDAVASLSPISFLSCEPSRLFEKVHDILRPGGRFVLGGVSSPESLFRVEPFAISQLIEDGQCNGLPEGLGSLRRAAVKTFRRAHRFWSVEGIEKLMRDAGFRVAVNTDILYGFGFLVVGEK